MTGGMTIWLRQRVAGVNIRIRELVRRQLRKLIELALSDMDLVARFRDATTTAAFEEEHLKDATHFKDRIQLYRWALSHVEANRELFLEFGVYKGDSINCLAALHPNVTWHGFDSFVGLPETWTLGAKAGAFSVEGEMPAIRENVRLIKGFFEDTLPDFVAKRSGQKIGVLHVDCDLYSSTKTVLANVKDMLVPGSIIIFDELINYHGWEEGEYKAFMEFVSEQNIAFEYLGYIRTSSQVAVRILDGAAARAVPGDARRQSMASAPI